MCIKKTTSVTVEVATAKQEQSLNGNGVDKKRKETTSNYFAKRNKEVQETAAFVLMKTRNQHMRSCKPKSVTKRARCHISIGSLLKPLLSGVSQDQLSYDDVKNQQLNSSSQRMDEAVIRVAFIGGKPAK